MRWSPKSWKTILLRNQPLSYYLEINFSNGLCADFPGKLQRVSSFPLNYQGRRLWAGGPILPGCPYILNSFKNHKKYKKI
jgi:hypothetical protein